MATGQDCTIFFCSLCRCTVRQQAFTDCKSTGRRDPQSPKYKGSVTNGRRRYPKDYQSSYWHEMLSFLIQNPELPTLKNTANPLHEPISQSRPIPHQYLQTPTIENTMPLAFSISTTPFTQSRNGSSSIRLEHKRKRCHHVCISMRTFWVQPETKTALTTSLEQNITDFIFTDKNFFNECSSIARFNTLLIPDSGHFENGLYSCITCAQDVTNLLEQAKKYKTIIMDSTDWKIIPAENLIATCQQTQTQILAMVNSTQEARSMFGMLQVGVDGCILRTDSIEEIISFANLKGEMIDKVGSAIQNLSFATVSDIRAVNMGERVCIDTCSMLAENEGMLIGSSSQSMCVVLSEAARTAYVPSRPFRVNAGAVHSYCMLAGGKTKYLAEICAGDEVMIVSDFGKSSRTAVVGRAKIESRPLLMIEALVEGDESNRCTLFVQNAETVRLAVVDEDGKGGMQSVSTLQIGTRLLLKSDKKARHVGLAIDENIIEK